MLQNGVNALNQHTNVNTASACYLAMWRVLHEGPWALGTLIVVTAMRITAEVDSVLASGRVH